MGSRGRGMAPGVWSNGWVGGWGSLKLKTLRKDAELTVEDKKSLSRRKTASQELRPPEAHGKCSSGSRILSRELQRLMGKVVPGSESCQGTAETCGKCSLRPKGPLVLESGHCKSWGEGRTCHFGMPVTCSRPH
jgi:hypothetical protein